MVFEMASGWVRFRQIDDLFTLLALSLQETKKPTRSEVPVCARGKHGVVDAFAGVRRQNPEARRLE
jgi:hypothetical protein